MSNKRSGFAIVYGLLILLFITVTGTAILVMTRSDRASATHYQYSQVAFQAAQAALKAVEGQLANAPDTVVATLKKFLTNSNYKWFFGAKVSDATTMQSINLGSDSKYSAKIIGFDSVNQLLTVEATGYDNTGSKKRITAMYKLSGLSAPPLKSLRPFGLFLGGALGYANSPMNIKGDVYLSMNDQADQGFNSAPCVINGNFKTGSINNLQINSDLAIVNGKAYIRCAMKCNTAITVNGKSGFEKLIDPMNQDFRLFDDAFFNSPMSNWNGRKVNMNEHAVTSKSIPATSFSNTSSYTSMAGGIDIAAQLGMTNTNEAIDTVKLPATWTVRYVSGDISASDVESWWSSGTLYQGNWLVLRLNGNVTMKGGNFTKKVIWITDNYTIHVNGNWYNCSSTSNTFIYVNGPLSPPYLPGTGLMNNMGVPDNKSFRGFIYVNSTSTITYQFGTNTTFNGAIEHAKGVFDLNSGTLNLDFSEGSSGQEAVQEIVDLGLIVAAN